MTDILNSDIRLIPACTSLTAQQLVDLFFDNWYCENSLPLEIVSDQDKLFLSHFWRALHARMGIKIKLSTAYHPEMDGSSERTKKTVIQALRFHIAQNQTGWVRALPHVCFDIMNTVNASTGFSPFQLHMGCLPCILPPLAPIPSSTVDEEQADALIAHIHCDVSEAQENLPVAKVAQAIQANKHCGPEPHFCISDYIMLNTHNHHREYQQKNDGQTAKLMPHWDRKYKVVRTFPDTSIYSIKMPNSPLMYSTFYASELHPYRLNNATLFPSRELPQPGPVITPDGTEEWLVDAIIDECCHGCGRQYLVSFAGYGPDYNRWLPRTELLENEALDWWEQQIL